MKIFEIQVNAFYEISAMLLDWQKLHKLRC